MTNSTVTMKVTTRADGEAYLVGNSYEVPKETADRWQDLGIADPGGAKQKEGELTAHQQAQQNVLAGDLEIASLHGDVAAARKLDAFRRGETTLEPAAAVAGEPAPSANAGTGEATRRRAESAKAQTTGDSARGALAR